MPNARTFDERKVPVEVTSVADDTALLLHGDKDTDVPYEQSVLMNAELDRHGIRHEFIKMPGLGHGFDEDFEDPKVAAAFDRALKFLERELKP